MGGKETARVKQIAKSFPSELKRANKALDSDLKRAIVVLLVDKNGLSFTQLQDELSTETDQLHQGFLSDALKDLQNGAIIKRIEKGEFKDRYEAEYRMTEFGHEYLDCIFRSIEPTEENILSTVVIDIGTDETISAEDTDWTINSTQETPDVAENDGEELASKATKSYDDMMA